jgi:FtsP/CotA-like multicopper oxidase with cupredoxin domain
MSNQLGRREFLKVAGAAGATGLAVVGTRFVRAQDPTATAHDMSAAQGGMDVDAMDAHHQEGVQVFLDRIGQDAAFWGTRLEPEMDGDVKVFNITCQDITWEVAPGQAYTAMAYNGIIPGPEIRVTEGDVVRVNVTNEMAQSTAVHFHGVLVPNAMDGVPFITQPPIKPGETFTYEFTARNSGSHMYHSHHNAAEQVTSGLLGAFIIEPRDASREPEVSGDYVFVLNDSTLGFTINGRSFPYTQPILAALGDRIRVRYMNEGLMIHPMHLHGLPQLVVSKDGYPLPVPYLCDTLNVAPGERYDVLVDCTEPGATFSVSHR